MQYHTTQYHTIPVILHAVTELLNISDKAVAIEMHDDAEPMVQRNTQ